ncbi:MAG TPA: protein kinase, partial [Roseiflexaceae bacterium]|nr:protein kinase [Roseiflexaceae bacterium]
MSDASEQQLGQYQLIELIRRGTMSAIYKAYQPSLARFVVIKVLFSDGDPQFAVRFKRSARMSAGLQHPNILQTYDFGEHGDRLFLVLQYVESGLTLDSLLGAPLSVADASQIMVRLLDALDYAHKRGIIHRDVKPTNVMMPTPNWPLLGDFGIAKLRTDTQRVTSSGLTIGTPAYMSPEQATGRPLDARTDLYAAGLVFYTMLTGRVPFDADTPMDMMLKQVYDPPILPRSLNPDIPPEIEQLVLRSLEKNPDARYQSAPEFAEAIRSLAPEPAEPQLHRQVDELYQAGVQALESGQWAAAIDLLGQLITLEPSYNDAAELLGVAREAQRHTRSAGGRLEAINATTPNVPQPMAPSAAKAQVDTAAGQPAAARKSHPVITTPLEAATAQAAAKWPAAEADILRCPRCGGEILPDWSTCPFCHETLSGPTLAQMPRISTAQADSSQAAPAAQRRRWRGLAVPIALLVVLGLGTTLALAFSRRAPAPPEPPATQPAAAILPTAQSQAIIAAPTEPPTAAPIAEPTSAPPTELPTPLPTATPPPTATPTTPPPDAVVNLEQLRLRNGPSTNFS